MSFDGLHETVIKDVIDVIKDGIGQAEDLGFTVRKSNSLSTSSSLSKATEGLILVFPHLCSTATSPETAQMLTKVIETKAVSLLQIAFSAFNITNSKDAVDFVKQFHTNIGGGKMSIDNFINAMDSVSNESNNSLNGVNRSLVKAVLEEFKQMECYFENDLSDRSINDFKVINRYDKYVVSEAKSKEELDLEKKKFTWQKNMDKAKLVDKERYYHDKEVNDQKRHEEVMAQKKAELDYRDKRDKVKDKNDDKDFARQQAADNNKAFKDDFDMIRQQLLTSDIKKANEAVPTMMVINFTTKEDQYVIRSQAVIGIKAKLYPASSNDIINKIIIKNSDNNVFLKLMRVSTRELNFVKDFLLAIDDAKLAAIGSSTKGSDTNKFLKILERRALKGKIRRRLNMNNAYKAITTITITKEEADFINRYNNIDVFNVNTIRAIMESLNIMMFIVADDTEECAHILMDTGEDMFERISYTHLEREAADGSYKKAINLMTKVVR